MSDICKTFIPSQRIVFETAPKIVFDVRATAGPNATLPGGKRMGELEMIETYTEKYLLTHSYLKSIYYNLTCTIYYCSFTIYYVHLLCRSALVLLIC